jgi:hypothetical protein
MLRDFRFARGASTMRAKTADVDFERHMQRRGRRNLDATVAVAVSGGRRRHAPAPHQPAGGDGAVVTVRPARVPRALATLCARVGAAGAVGLARR